VDFVALRQNEPAFSGRSTEATFAACCAALRGATGRSATSSTLPAPHFQSHEAETRRAADKCHNYR
jgi:hypothetical protein